MGFAVFQRLLRSEAARRRHRDVHRIVAHYAEMASQVSPFISLIAKRVSPIRQTTVVHLLRAGVDIKTI
jgi:hypothetical protein